jgi:phage portal protein BeeE
MDLFGIKSTIRNIVTQTALNFSNNLAVNGLYNEKLFAWINDNQPIFWEDNPNNYVQNGYQGNGDVYSVVDLILTKLAYCPLKVYSVKTDKLQQAQKYKTLHKTDYAKAELFRIQTKAINEVDIPGITALLNKPNPYQTTTEWLKQLIGFYLLTGNSYNYYNGLPGSKKWTEMFVLPSPLMNIVSGGDLMPVKGYNIFNSINYRNGVPDFPAESVSHFKTFNPHFSTYGSQLYGQSPLRAYIMTLVRNRDSRLEQNKQVKNGGVMGILSPKMGAPNINDPRIKADLKQQIAEAKGSSDLVKRIFVSGVPAEWIQFGLSSTDLQLLESIGLDRIEICNAYHVRPELMGNIEASTDNNMAWAAKQLCTNACMPLGDTVTDKLTRDICPAYETPGEKLFIMFDYSLWPEMSDDLQKIATALASMWWITPNEKRTFQGFDESTEPDANSILIPKTYGRLQDIALLDDSFTNVGNEK